MLMSFTFNSGSFIIRDKLIINIASGIDYFNLNI